MKYILLINGEKIEPECLQNAKTYTIFKPVQYIKSPDNTYNVVYTAKYKTNENTTYAVFNEKEKISPVADGFIGIPHISPDEKHVAYVMQKEEEW